MTKHKNQMRLTRRGKRLRAVILALAVAGIHAPAINQWQQALTNIQFFEAVGLAYIVAVIAGLWVMEYV